MALLTYAGVVQDKAVAAAADRFIPIGSFARGIEGKDFMRDGQEPLPYAGADLPKALSGDRPAR